ncbi:MULTISPECIES: hypothetical protein [Pseudomonas]|uniref:hypothetical protein n=1 Tax=Pseudomonas TaxID=286 RepID=UPI0023D7EC79|nr:hypothetical protein [Pseudomonas sp. 273]
MRVCLLAGALLLVACSSRPAPEPRSVRVEVPIAVPCRAPMVAEPVWATTGLAKADGLQAKVRALLAERQQHLGYEARLRAALQACR